MRARWAVLLFDLRQIETDEALLFNFASIRIRNHAGGGSQDSASLHDGQFPLRFKFAFLSAVHLRHEISDSFVGVNLIFLNFQANPIIQILWIGVRNDIYFQVGAREFQAEF